MPTYKVGDLVRPAGFDEDPDVVGLILETRDMPDEGPEVRVLWSDLIGQAPKWTFVSEVIPLETTTDA